MHNEYFWMNWVTKVLDREIRHGGKRRGWRRGWDKMWFFLGSLLNLLDSRVQTRGLSAKPQTLSVFKNFWKRKITWWPTSLSLKQKYLPTFQKPSGVQCWNSRPLDSYQVEMSRVSHAIWTGGHCEAPYSTNKPTQKTVN